MLCYKEVICSCSVFQAKGIMEVLDIVNMYDYALFLQWEL